MLKLLIIEDHALVREGLVLAVRQLSPKQMDIMEAGDAEAGFRIVSNNPGLDLVLLDLALPGQNGLSCLEKIRRRFPAIPVAVISAYDDVHTVYRALNGGASGFIPKAYDTDQMLCALRQILEGQVFVPERLIPTKLDNTQSFGIGTTPEMLGLTERQAEVLRLMACGNSNREIAGTLGVCEGTVKLHMRAVFRALQVSSRTQALLAISQQQIKL